MLIFKANTTSVTLNRIKVILSLKRNRYNTALEAEETESVWLGKTYVHNSLHVNLLVMKF